MYRGEAQVCKCHANIYFYMFTIIVIMMNWSVKWVSNDQSFSQISKFVHKHIKTFLLLYRMKWSSDSNLHFFFLKWYFLKNTNRVYTFFSFFTLYPCKVIPFTIKILWAAKHGRRYYYRVIWDLGLVRWSMSFVGAIRAIFDRFLFERKCRSSEIMMKKEV